MGEAPANGESTGDMRTFRSGARIQTGMCDFTSVGGQTETVIIAS